MTVDKVFKFPKKMGACADKLYVIQGKRLALKKQVEELQKEETALKNHIIDNLPKSEASGIAGVLARVTIVKKPVPQVEDWDKFYKYIKRTGSFDLMQRRTSNGAIKERWDNGKEVPGVGHHTVVTVSMNKV